MPTRAQTKRKPPTKAAEEVAGDATEPAEEMATKAEVQSLEEALRADLEVLAEKMVALISPSKKNVAHGQRPAVQELLRPSAITRDTARGPLRRITARRYRPAP